MRIALVLAASRNGVIGQAGGLPWRVPSDLRRFKEITMGKPILMGRKTWEGLPRKPLPGRPNIVLTRNPGYVAAGASVAENLDAALALCAGAEEVCVIGGGAVFNEALARATRIYLTEIDLDAVGDTYFSLPDPKVWRESLRENHARGSGDDAAFTLRILDRA